MVLNGELGRKSYHDVVTELYLINPHKYLFEKNLSPGKELKLALPEYDSRLLIFMNYHPDPSE
jgi:hypothetical protein